MVPLTVIYVVVPCWDEITTWVGPFKVPVGTLKIGAGGVCDRI